MWCCSHCNQNIINAISQIHWLISTLPHIRIVNCMWCTKTHGSILLSHGIKELLISIWKTNYVHCLSENVKKKDFGKDVLAYVVFQCENLLEGPKYEKQIWLWLKPQTHILALNLIVLSLGFYSIKVRVIVFMFNIWWLWLKFLLWKILST